MRRPSLASTAWAHGMAIRQSETGANRSERRPGDFRAHNARATRLSPSLELSGPYCRDARPVQRSNQGRKTRLRGPSVHERLLGRSDIRKLSGNDLRGVRRERSSIETIGEVSQTFGWHHLSGNEVQSGVGPIARDPRFEKLAASLAPKQ